MKFAKLFELEDGNQILVTKNIDYDSEIFELLIQIIVDGNMIKISPEFKTDIEVHNAFDNFTKDNAIKTRKNLLELLDS